MKTLTSAGELQAMNWPSAFGLGLCHMQYLNHSVEINTVETLKKKKKKGQ